MRVLPLGILASLIFIFSACGQSGPAGSADIDSKLKSGKELASRDGVTIHEGYVELLQQINPNIQNQLKTPAGKKRLVDNLLEQEILYRESVKRGIQNKPRYKEKAALYERVIISQGLLEEEIETQAKEYYGKNKEKEFSQVQIAHILFRTRKARPGVKGDKGVTEAQAKAKAQEAKKKLDSGVAWEEVVTEYTDDRLTKSRGGDLGKISREDRRAARLQWKDLITAAFEMKMGDISDPIKARDGFHIIKITEAVSVAPFDEVSNRIKFKLRGQVKKEVLEELTGDSKIVYEDEELKGLASKPGGPQPFLQGKPAGQRGPAPAQPAPKKEAPKKKEAAKPEGKKS